MRQPEDDEDWTFQESKKVQHFTRHEKDVTEAMVEDQDEEEIHLVPHDSAK